MLTVFGNSAIYLIMNQGATDLANTVQQDVALALFNFLEHFPFSSVLSFIAMAMVIVFFVTSADSGAMVVDTLASGGVANTPSGSEFWASLMGIVAIALLLAGGLSALQTVTIASALPFSVILLISIYGLLKALRRDLTKRESLSMATIAPTAARNPIPWQRRLRNIAYLPKRSLVKRFMDDVIQPAMTLVQEELNKQGTISHISDTVEDRIRLEVDLGNELNFIYEVRLRGYSSPTFRTRRDG
ncbi:secondary glycine betaine transporter BetU [Klebsiella pneumoniae]|nr:secondary glycine betaine transporter BetU [Klebsiella pneumoniae]